MIEGATVTLPLNEFDELRTDSEDFYKLTRSIAACFDYEYKEYGMPEECKDCKKVNPNCTKCKVYKENPPYEETLTVDTQRLINIAKQYALCGTDIESDVEEMIIVEKKKRGGGK